MGWNTPWELCQCKKSGVGGGGKAGFAFHNQVSGNQSSWNIWTIFGWSSYSPFLSIRLPGINRLGCRLWIQLRHTDLWPQLTGSSGIVPRNGMSYSEANFFAPPLEKSAQCSCGCTEQRCQSDVIIMSFYCRQSWRLGFRLYLFLPFGRQSASIPGQGLHWVSFPDHPKKWKEGLVFWVTLTWRELLEKECCNCILQLRLQLSDLFRWLQGVGYKAWEGCEVSRDSWEQAVRQIYQFGSNCMYNCLCHV